MEAKEEKQIVDFASKEKLPLMTHDDYRKMIIEAKSWWIMPKTDKKAKSLKKNE